MAEMPFRFRWCCEPQDDDNDELCGDSESGTPNGYLQLGTPENVTLTHITISNLLKDKTIAINPIEGATEATSENYHFQLVFLPGILAEPEKIRLGSESWSIFCVDENNSYCLYLLWIGDAITLTTNDTTEVILEGLAAESPERRATTTNVTVRWKLNEGDIEIINIDKAPPPSSDYEEYINLELEMVKTTGNSNIPLYVGFVGSNKVLNTHDEASSLQLRITNTSLPGADNPDITFHYDNDSSSCSQLVVLLEVGTTTDVPWALGTPDQVNGMEISVGTSSEWQQNGDIEEIKVGTTVKALQWTFIPQSENVVLSAQDTILIDLKKIITAHPTGETNLYLRYQYVEGYKDGQFICQIEKAPLVFDKKVRIGTTKDLDGLLTVKDGISLDSPGEIQNTGTIIFRSDVDKTDELSSVQFFKKDEDIPLMELDSDANLEVINTLTARRIFGDGAIITGMILMWSGEENEIPDGWALCNGSNGTPNLSNRFIVGAGSSSYYQIRDMGGSDSVTLNVEQMPSHNHGVIDPGHQHGYKIPKRWHADDGKNEEIADDDTFNSASTESAKTDISIDYTGGGEPHENRPPYYALCFIMKIDVA